MEIILLENVPGIGYKGDQVTVRGGYGRNYLISRRLACVANKVNSAVNTENFKQAKNRIAEEKRQARKQKEELSRINLSIEARVAANGNIYGSIGPIQVAEALHKEGFEILEIASNYMNFTAPSSYVKHQECRNY